MLLRFLVGATICLALATHTLASECTPADQLSDQSSGPFSIDITQFAGDVLCLGDLSIKISSRERQPDGSFRVRSEVTNGGQSDGVLEVYAPKQPGLDSTAPTRYLIPGQRAFSVDLSGIYGDAPVLRHSGTMADRTDRVRIHRIGVDVVLPHKGMIVLHTHTDFALAVSLTRIALANILGRQPYSTMSQSDFWELSTGIGLNAAKAMRREVIEKANQSWPEKVHRSLTIMNVLTAGIEQRSMMTIFGALNGALQLDSASMDSAIAMINWAIQEVYVYDFEPTIDEFRRAPRFLRVVNAEPPPNPLNSQVFPKVVAGTWEGTLDYEPHRISASNPKQYSQKTRVQVQIDPASNRMTVDYPELGCRGVLTITSEMPPKRGKNPDEFSKYPVNEHLSKQAGYCANGGVVYLSHFSAMSSARVPKKGHLWFLWKSPTTNQFAMLGILKPTSDSVDFSGFSWPPQGSIVEGCSEREVLKEVARVFADNGVEENEVLTLVEAARYAPLSQNVYDDGFKKNDTFQGWKIIDEDQREIGFARAYLKDDAIVIAFRGTDSLEDAFWVDFVGTFTGHPEDIYATRFVSRVSKGNRQKRIVVTGHSMGGRFAQVALMGNPEVVKAYTFNSAPISLVTGISTLFRRDDLVQATIDTVAVREKDDGLALLAGWNIGFFVEVDFVNETTGLSSITENHRMSLMARGLSELSNYYGSRRCLAEPNAEQSGLVGSNASGDVSLVQKTSETNINDGLRSAINSLYRSWVEERGDAPEYLYRTETFYNKVATSWMMLTDRIRSGGDKQELYDQYFNAALNYQHQRDFMIIQAKRALDSENLATVRHFYDQAIRLDGMYNNSMSASVSTYNNDLDSAYKLGEGVYAASKYASIYGSKMLLGPTAASAVERLFTVTDFYVTRSRYGTAVAVNELAINELIKVSLDSVPLDALNGRTISKSLTSASSETIGQSGLYELMSEAIESEHTKKTIMKFLADSADVAVEEGSEAALREYSELVRSIKEQLTK